MQADKSQESKADSEYGIEEPPVPEQFAVRDEASASWVIRHIVQARAYAARVAEWCARETARARHEEEFFFFRFGQQLRDWASTQIAQNGGRRKSIALPSGMVGFRRSPERLVVDDEEAVILWAKQHKPELITIVEKLSKSGLAQWASTTGEVPERGVHVEPARDEFFVR